MASYDNEKPKATQQRERFYIDNQADLETIKEFEKELEPYLKRESNLFGRVLRGFELYLHENALFRYSTRYPYGAVVFENLEKYHLVDMKYRALKELWDRRFKAEQKEKERIQTLIPEGSMA